MNGGNEDFPLSFFHLLHTNPQRLHYIPALTKAYTVIRVYSLSSRAF